MKKTFSININGLLFNIDEDAFEKLSNYLKTLKKHFKNTEGGDDIVNDIEARIAELLKAKLNDIQQIIGIDDVDAVIETLGQPFEMDEESENTHQSARQNPFKKRLFRDPDNQIIAGVASGLAAYFSIDATIVRLLFVLSILIGGVGIVIYLTLWILTPLALTTAEKLEMEGVNVDIHTIEKKVREELASLGNRLQDFTNEAGDVFKKKSKASANGLNSFGQFIGKVLHVFLRIVGIIVGIVFLIIGIALSISMAATILGLIPAIQVDEFTLEAISLPTFLNTYLFSTSFGAILNISLFVVIAIPVIALLFNGVRLIFNFGRQRYLGLVTLIIWVLASVVAVTLSVETFKQFKTESNQEITNRLDSVRNDTLNLAIYNQEFYKTLDENLAGSITIDHETVLISTEDKFYGNPDIRFAKAKGDVFELVVRSSARGETAEKASKRLENTRHYFEVKDNTLYLDPYFTLALNEKWRDQEVLFEIRVPRGKTLHIEKEVRNYFQWHYWHHSRWSMSGHYWLMTDDGLVRTDPD